MIPFEDLSVKIDCALPFSWKKGTGYARPRSFEALSFRIRGNADYTHDNKEYHAETNDILFVPAKYDYTIHSNTSEDVLVVHFFIENSPLREMRVFTPVNPDVFQRLFSEICETWRVKPVGYKPKMAAIFYRILEQLEIQQVKKELLVKPKTLQEALDFLHENFSNPETTVETTASHVGISSVYLRKLFHAQLNQTPLHYLTALRIEHAKALLKTGYYSVEEIATLSGFNDAKYFSSLYKKYVGISPSKRLKRALVQAKK